MAVWIASSVVQALLVVFGLFVVWRVLRAPREADDDEVGRGREARRNVALMAGSFIVCFGVFNLVSGGFSAAVRFFEDAAPSVVSDCSVEWDRGPFGLVCIEPVAP